MGDEPPQEKGLHQLMRFVGPSQALQPALTLGISVIIARSLGPEGRGGYGLVIAMVALLPMVLGLGMPFAARYWTARGEVDRRSLLKTITLIGTLLGVVASVTVLTCWATGRPDWLLPPDLGPTAAATLAGVLFLGVLQAFWANYLSGQERYGFMTWGTNATLGIQLLFLFVFWRLSLLSLDVAVFSIGVQYACLCALFLALSGRDLIAAVRAPFLDFGQVPEMLRYALWVYLSGLLMQLNVRVNIFMLVALGGLYETGLYAAVLGPASFLTLLTSPLILVLSSRTTRRADDPSFPPRVAGALRLMVVISAVPAAGAAAVAPVVLPWLFGDRFSDSVAPFWLLLPGVIAFAVVHAISQYLAGVKRPKWITGISATGAIATVMLNLLLIPRFGASGAAISYSLAFLVAALVGGFAFCRVGGLSFRELVVFRASDWAPLARILGIRAVAKRDSADAELDANASVDRDA